MGGNQREHRQKGNEKKVRHSREVTTTLPKRQTRKGKAYLKITLLAINQKVKFRRVKKEKKEALQKNDGRSVVKNIEEDWSAYPQFSRERSNTRCGPLKA